MYASVAWSVELKQIFAYLEGRFASCVTRLELVNWPQPASGGLSRVPASSDGPLDVPVRAEKA